MRSSIFVLSSCSLLLGACSSMSEADSAKAFGATYSVLGAGASQAEINGGTPAQGGDDVQLRASGQVDYSFACPLGGTAQFAGTLDATTDGSGTASSFTLATDFQGCDAGGIVIDGELDYASSVTTSGDAVSTTLTMNGGLSFSGDVDGACDFDLSMKVGVGGGSVNAEYSGTICGHKASATLSG